MKKLITAVLTFAMVSAMSLTAFAADTTVNQDSDPKAGDTIVNYSVDPTYTVTITEKVTLGDRGAISVSDVVVDEGKQVNVKLTDTSEADNSFQVKTDKGAALSYTITKDGSPLAIGDTVLSVKPGEATIVQQILAFSAPTGARYAGTYTGTVTFTVSVDDVTA